MRISSLLLAGLLSIPASAFVGQWHSYTDKTHVIALAEHNGFVYAGTTGGIRRVTQASLAETDFDNLEGLIDVWVVAFVHGADGTLWAVARDGYLYTLKGARWEVSGRSYQSLGWKMNDRAALAAGSYFYLGSLKGLTLFDATQKVAQVNITRFQNETEVSVLSLLRRADTLFVGTTRGVYKAAVYFADPLNPPDTLGYENLADPTIWSKVSSDIGYSLAVRNDSVVAGGNGTLIETPVRVEAFTGRPLVIGSQTYPAAWDGFRATVRIGGRVFVGGDSGLFVSETPTGSVPDAHIIAPLQVYPRDTIFNIGANAGRIWGHSPKGVHQFSAGGEFVTSSAGVIHSPALLDRNLRSLKVDPNGDVYVGVWGTGLNRVRDNVVETWNHGTNPCIFQAFPPNDPWTVATALSEPRNGGLYFSVFRTEGSGDHQLVYLDVTTRAIHCLDAGTSIPGGYPHAVHSFSDTLLGVTSEDGLSLFKTKQGLSAPILEFKGQWSVKGAAPEAWDLATDRWGRPWALIGATLASLDFDSLDVPSGHYLDGVQNFSGEDCKSLESDAAGTLWVGCTNGLFSATTGIAGGLGTVRRYGTDDGLLSLKIHDISVDPTTGKVWIATDRGVSMLEGAGPPALPSGSLTTIVPYPNPFKPQHRFVIFDKLPRNSTLRIHNAAGNVVRIFRPSEMIGNQVQWDGKNEQGQPVTAGVYLFSVVSGSDIQRGKVIVAR